jgi:hypothetical protein
LNLVINRTLTIRKTKQMPNPQIPVGFFDTFAVTGTDSNGNPAVLEPGDVTTAVSSSPSIGVAIDPTPATASLFSGTLTAVAPPTAGISIIFTIVHTDGTSATLTDMVDVPPAPSGEATTLGVTLGAPQPVVPITKKK